MIVLGVKSFYKFLLHSNHSLTTRMFASTVQTRICASLGSRMKFKTLYYPVFGRNKNTALPSF